MLDNILIDLLQYKNLCIASDKILDAASSIDEIVSIPILHVLREHPEFLKLYNFIFNNDNNSESNNKTKNLFKVFSLIKSSLFDYKINNVPLNSFDDSKQMIIVSHITNINQCSNFDDEYFGGFHDDLFKFSNIKPIILLINHTNVSSTILSKELAKNHINRIVIPKSCGLINELKIFFRLVSSVHSFTKSAKFTDPIALSLIRNLSRPGTFLSGMTALRIGFFVEKFVKMANPKYIFTTFEGHASEKIIFSSARKVNKDILCFGYQHSILNKYQHSITRNIHQKYNPDHIFCCGKITKDILSELKSLNGTEISILGSPKASPIGLSEVLPLTKLSNSLESSKNFTFLFLPEGFEAEYKVFFKFILECAKAFPSSSFVWRSHPLLDLQELELFKEKEIPLNITISKNTFDEDLKGSDIAIYRGTAAIIRAVMGNLVPIYLQKKGEIGIDIMHSLKLNRVFSVSDLKHIIQSSNLLNNRDGATKFCKDYFRPMECNSFIKVVDQYGS